MQDFSKKSIKMSFFSKKLRFFSKITGKSENLLHFTKKMTVLYKLSQNFHIFLFFYKIL